MTDITKILVANRGEIACRVIRTARSLGIRTVAVYSDADANSPHTKLADEAVHIGPSSVNESYLVIQNIIDAAIATNADAIHPGYGFLSENAAFSKACEKNKIVFIGPPELAIDVMGDKARSKRAMLEADVPCVPGYQGEDQTDKILIDAAKDIGLPVMVKAAAGGGGRGMRLVHKAKDLPSAIKLARSEAENAFGSGVLIIEKAVQEPRHVEIQVFADSHGNVIHLGERDCSVQRRHQKVIEEAPCPVMTPELRSRMGEAAVAAARAVDYRGAGTVEFLLDKEGSFYFLEMNTRLQVEHPVTEEITGLDLVALQISVAEGKPLPLTQEDVKLTGHAIEVRLYAEDPANDFLPCTGPVLLWAPPKGQGIRVDDGIETGSEISPFYDAMVAKIIAYGETRASAIRRLRAALESTALFGLATNRDFLIDALDQPKFKDGLATTAFIGEVYGDEGFASSETQSKTIAVAAALDGIRQRSQSLSTTVNVHPELLNWSSTKDLNTAIEYAVSDELVTVGACFSARQADMSIGDASLKVLLKRVEENHASVSVDGCDLDVTYLIDDNDRIHLASNRSTHVLHNRSMSIQPAADAAGGGSVLAPMHGKLIEIAVATGDQVTKGQKLAVLEAMKMQHEIVAEINGVVESISGTVEEQIAADDMIMEISTPDK